MPRTILLTAATLFCARASLAQPAETQSLINGKDLTGWHADVPAADNNPDIKPSFIARDGMLVSMGNPPGHLITDAIFENYRLEVEYRFAADPGNCGVLVHASTPRALYAMFPQSIEVQMHHNNAGDFWCIAENIAVDDMANRRAGSPDNWGGGPQNSRRVLNMTDGSENPPGQWNRMVIECLDDQVRVWVNGDLVNNGFDCTAARGHIALQAEGVEVEFRRVDLTPISKLSPATDKAQLPIKIFILAGQSNMEGKAQVKLLDHQIKDPQTAELFEHLHTNGQYTIRDDVWINYLNRRGNLTVGYGSPDRFGVELEFGNVLGDHFEEPVLLIKTAWGGKSLHRDFRPPSAGLPSQEALEEILRKTNEGNRKNNRPEITIEDVKSSYGRYYRDMMNNINTTLNQMGSHFPRLDGRDYEIAGFVWFQGWNDQYNGAEQEYESNMAHFIRDVRAELNSPDLPFIIGVMGQNGSKHARGPMLAIQNAQLAMEQLPSFKGNARAVRTDALVDTEAESLYPHWKERTEEWEKTGSDHPYHYFGSALWFSRMGTAFGEAMLELIDEAQED